MAAPYRPTGLSSCGKDGSTPGLARLRSRSAVQAESGASRKAEARGASRPARDCVPVEPDEQQQDETNLGNQPQRQRGCQDIHECLSLLEHARSAQLAPVHGGQPGPRLQGKGPRRHWQRRFEQARKVIAVDIRAARKRGVHGFVVPEDHVAARHGLVKGIRRFERRNRN